MGQARDRAGNIWETDDVTGEAVRLLQPAASSTGRVVTLPKSEKQLNDEARQVAAEARATRDQQLQEEAAARAQKEYDATHNGDGTKKVDSTPDKLAVIPPVAATAFQENLTALRKAEEALGALDAQHGGRPRSIGPGTGALGQYFLNWHDPDGTKTRAAVAAIGAQKIHDLSGAAVSASEAPRFQPFVPTVTDTPEVAKDKLLQFRDQLKQQITEAANFYSPANGYRPYSTPGLADVLAAQPQQHADREIDPVTLATKADAGPTDPGAMPAANEPGGSDPTPPPPTPASGGGTQSVARPDIASMVRSMVAAHAGYATINAALKAKGARTLTFSEYNDAKKGRGIVASEERPLSLMERANATAPGAFVVQGVNALTGGLPAYLLGDQAQGTIAGMDAAHPTASGLGQAVGGIAGAITGEGLLAGAAPRLAGWAPRIADSAFGGVQAFTGSDGDLGKAAMGAITAPIAGAAGERFLRGAGSVFRGVTNPAVERLRAAGIPLTFGQAAGQSGRLGNAINKTEQAMTSVPGVGSMIGGRFDDGTRGLNRAAFEIGAETTGNQVQDVGSAGVEQLRQLVGNTYDNALDGARLDVTDPAVAQDIMNAQLVASSIPQVGQNAVDAIDYRVAGGTGLDGTMDGRDFQETYRGLGRDGRSAARDSYGHEYQGAMGQAQDALASGLEVQNPGAYEGFVNANTANRRAMVLADAVNAAKNQSDEMFTPAQLNAADANSATRLTGRLNSASGNRPFHQLAQDAQQVMGNRLPNSGTADRAMTGLLMGTLTGAGAGAGAGYLGGDTGSGATGGAALAALLMAGGTRTGQRALTSMLLDRPAFARAIGDSLQRHAQLGGGFGAGILTPLLVGAQN